jgi:dihydrofolate synthase / folylpolyglutamate synthase
VAGVPWVFDVAHNVAGAEALSGALESLQLPRPLVAIIGVLGDKDWAGMMGPLCAAADQVILTLPPTAPAGRRWDPEAVLAEVPCTGATVIDNFTAALEAAHGRANAGGGCVLVTGSFHTVGDALAALGLAPDGADFSIAAPGFLPPSPRAG